MQIGISSMDINAVVEAVQKRLSLLPNLKSTVESLDNEIAQILVKDAVNQAITDGFTELNIEMGAVYLAAHFCNVISATNTNISKQQASVLTIEYFDRAGVDDYLLEYKRLKSSLSSNSIQFL